MKKVGFFNAGFFKDVFLNYSSVFVFACLSGSIFLLEKEVEEKSRPQ
jgi:hypothetical protein